MIEIDRELIAQVLEQEAEFYIEEDHKGGTGIVSTYVRLDVSLMDIGVLADKIADAIAEDQADEPEHDAVALLKAKARTLKHDASAKKESSFANDWVSAYTDVTVANRIEMVLAELDL